MMKTDNVLVSKNTRLIIDFLLLNFSEKYNINRMAEKLGISVSDTHRVLKKLEKAGIVSCEKIGNGLFYELNLESRDARKIAELVITQRDMNSYAKVYAEDLEGLREYCKACILFGSILVKGEKARDIDVFVVTDKNKVKRVEDFCLELSTRKGRIIQPLLHTEKDVVDNLRRKDEVVLRILREGALLWGEEIIVEAIRHGKTR